MAISYKLPKPKKSEQEKNEPMPVDEIAYMRRVRIPVSKEQVQALNVGDDETVTLKGVVKELESRESEDQGFNELVIEVAEVEVSASNEFEKLTEDDV